MAGHTQRLLWTALPNGFSEDHKRLRISAMVSPRLIVTPGPDDVLEAFPDMLAWPAIIRNAVFEIVFAGVTVKAQRVSQPEDAMHARLFGPKTVVIARQFEDRRGTGVLSYPNSAVEQDIADIYGKLALEATGDVPSHFTMRGHFASLGRELNSGRYADRFMQWRDQGRRDHADTVAGRLDLVDLYNAPLSEPMEFGYTKQGSADLREDTTWESHQIVPLADAESLRRTFDFHQIVESLAQYPVLLRATGLVVDLEVDRSAFSGGDLVAPMEIHVRWSPVAETERRGVTLIADVFPQTISRLHERTFEAASDTPGNPSQVDGFLQLREHGFSLSQLDVNGSALKLRQFALGITMRPMPSDAAAPHAIEIDPVRVPPEKTGTPALRSGGITLALDGRGSALVDRFTRSGAMEDALTAGTPIILHHEDLVRGYYVEILDADRTDGALWRSICRRDTLFTFIPSYNTFEYADNEGILRLAASGASDGSNPDVVKLAGGLFTWSGWSLTVSPIGRSVDGSDKVSTATSTAPVGLPLEVSHTVRARSLPSLRYGHRYSVRLRVVDLAGNAALFDPARPSPPLAESETVRYLRYEPLESPAVALVGTGAGTVLPLEGEDLMTAAIRSLNATFAQNTVPTTQQTQRHIVPPVGSQKLAELHSMLDAGGRLNPATYPLLAARDHALTTIKHPVTGKELPTGEIGFALPYLPDPLAIECVVQIYGRTAHDSIETLSIPWYRGAAAWPDAQAFRIELLEIANAVETTPTFDKDTRVLQVPLAKADWVRVRVGHLLNDEFLGLFGIWQWALDRMPTHPAIHAKLLKMAHSGEHWMLTPWRDIELVHAVQRPLVIPAIEKLNIARSRGDTMARLWFTTPADSRSTEKFDLTARWYEPVDDPLLGDPQAHASRAHAAELKLLRLEAPGFNPPGRRTWTARDWVDHGFADTRYRRVNYQLTATTRFTRFLPAELRDPARAADLCVTSAEVVGFVPNASPPPAPDIVYVMPTFGWSRSSSKQEERSWRSGGGLRVYLRRPWLVTGYMEMLAVVLAPSTDAGADPALARHMTEWGADPTWTSSAVTGVAPTLNRFPLAVTAGPIEQARLASPIPAEEGDLPGAFLLSVPLPGVPGEPMVDVVPHLVSWDGDRKLWYADIVITPGNMYGPLIKLALARYQPISASGAHLSPVTTTELVQLLADRLALLTGTAPKRYRVGLYGHAPQQHDQRVVEFAVERLATTAQSDLAWEPLEGVNVGDAPPPILQTPTPRPFSLNPRPVKARAASAQGSVLHKDPAVEAQHLYDTGQFDKLIHRSDLIDSLRPPLIREVEIELPRTRDKGERFRLVILEIELRNADAEHVRTSPGPLPERDPRRRIVYAETIELT